VAVFIGYLIFSRISLGNYPKMYDKVSEFIDKIIDLIGTYEEGIVSKKVCWSCFKEIEKETPNCPHCGTNL
jgi:hypothetical protein